MGIEVTRNRIVQANQGRKREWEEREIKQEKERGGGNVPSPFHLLYEVFGREKTRSGFPLGKEVMVNRDKPWMGRGSGSLRLPWSSTHIL